MAWSVVAGAAGVLAAVASRLGIEAMLELTAGRVVGGVKADFLAFLAGLIASWVFPAARSMSAAAELSAPFGGTRPPDTWLGFAVGRVALGPEVATVIPTAAVTTAAKMPAATRRLRGRR
jgi:hypothetical protein